MGNRGRYGKYGESKRIGRLRKSKATRISQVKAERKPGRAPEFLKKHESDADQIRLRPARGTDMAFLYALSKRVFRQYGSYEENITQWYQSENTYTLVATFGKCPAGFAMLGPIRHERHAAEVSELLAIAVEPGKQHKGIGSLLMTEMLKKAKAWQIEIMMLHTYVQNEAAKKLFEKCGFTPVEIKKNFYPQGQNAMVMIKTLA